MNNEALAKGMKYYKENERDRKIMCDAVEKYEQQRETRLSIKLALKYGDTKDSIVADLCDRYELSKEEADRAYEDYIVENV